MYMYRSYVLIVTPRLYGHKDQRPARTNEHMASPAEYGSVPACDVHVEFVSSGSTQKRWSIGKVIGAVFVVRQRVPNSIRSFWEASNLRRSWRVMSVGIVNEGIA